MNVDAERLALDLDRPFAISRGTTETVENVVVRVSDGEREGVGAATPATRYGETADTVEAVLPRLAAAVEAIDDPHDLARVERATREAVHGNPAARAAVSVACHDLAAKHVGLPLYRHLGLDPGRTPPTSFTLGIADPEETRERGAAAVAAGYDVLKVKVGADADADRERLAAIREVAPDATIRVDANEAWGPREALARIDDLVAVGVEFVEQPVPAEDPDGLRFVRERSPLPVAVDEGCVTPDDLPAVADRADVVVVKLAKCGGIRPARRLIGAARVHGLDVMLGCMVGTNAAIAAAMHLAPCCTYADLDGSLLLADDPYDGVPTDGSRIDLGAATRPGTGAVRG